MVFNLNSLTWRRGTLLPMPIWEADSVTMGTEGEGLIMLGGRGLIDQEMDTIYRYVRILIKYC